MWSLIATHPTQIGVFVTMRLLLLALLFPLTASADSIPCGKAAFFAETRQALEATITYCSKLNWDKSSLQLNCKDRGKNFQCTVTFRSAKGTPFRLVGHPFGDLNFILWEDVDQPYDEEGNPLPPIHTCQPRVNTALVAANMNSGVTVGWGCHPKKNWP